MADPMTQRSTIRRLAVPALLAGLAACSTQNVSLVAVPGETMNPNANGDSAAVDVYAFFLKRREKFDAASLAEVLPAETRRTQAPPPLLADDTVVVHRLTVGWQGAGKTAPTEKLLEVSREALFVGLAVRFQEHDRGDKDEVNKLVMPLDGNVTRFSIVGKQLRSGQPPKETPRAKPDDS